jgi:cytidine deaminase
MKKYISISYDYFPSADGLNSEQLETLKAAEKAHQKAHAPYSNFKVGAALLLNDGKMIYGSNQENKAFPSGLCAERVALFSYGAHENGQGIAKLAIMAVDSSGLNGNGLLSPCGGCRQAMVEYSNLQDTPFEIIMQNSDGSVVVFQNIKDLMPMSFGIE